MMIRIERTKLEETLELLNNRTRWALELTWKNPQVQQIHPFQTKEEALEHQLKILDSLVKDYIVARGK